jgi:hypothetical protein
MASTLVVEDGTGIVNADSYCSSAFAVTYLGTRGDTTFAALSQAAQDNALRLATDYMLGEYRYKWAGYRFGLTQSLDWPRSYVPIVDVAFGYGPAPSYYAFDIVPLPVAQACADLALKSLSGLLAPDIEQGQTMVKVGPISVQYDRYSNRATFYRAIQNKLRPYLLGQGGRNVIVRT